LQITDKHNVTAAEHRGTKQIKTLGTWELEGSTSRCS
jgi:hypothetical protein